MKRIASIQHERRSGAKTFHQVRDFAEGFQVDRLIDKVVQQLTVDSPVISLGNFQ